MASKESNVDENVDSGKLLKHWFYEHLIDGKTRWTPFNFIDSKAIEEAFLSGKEQQIATDGGRFEVNIVERTRQPVYWTAESTSVRRCSWFLMEGIGSHNFIHQTAKVFKTQEMT